MGLEQGMVLLRAGKGDKDRRTVLPESLREELTGHIQTIRVTFEKDRAAQAAGVSVKKRHVKKTID